jgi:hypothetical protein
MIKLFVHFCMLFAQTYVDYGSIEEVSRLSLTYLKRK